MLDPNLAVPLSQDFYDRPPQVVARELIGKLILRKLDDQVIGGAIVETEAYLANGDPASHSHRGRTRRNQSMFASPGTLYVYTIHAKYCLNVATEPAGVGSAVLIRAIEPIFGIAAMRSHRAQFDLRKLCRGPAMLCQSLAVDTRLDGISLIGNSDVVVAAAPQAATFKVRSSPRIGIRLAAELPLRYFVDGNQFVSGRASLHTRRPKDRLFDSVNVD